VTRVSIPPPLGLLAELTHRCALRCPYCSNPLELERRSAELTTAEWCRVFDEAAALGVLQVYFSGGEPMLRADIADLVAHAVTRDLYTNLITSGVGYDAARLRAVSEAGLDHVQLSVQGVDDEAADRVAGYAGAAAAKRVLAARVRDLGLRLTINAVVHRANVADIPRLVDMAISWGAARLEIAHVQYYGWAVPNRRALMPTRAQVEQAHRDVADARARTDGQLVIDYVVPDYYSRVPKPCMGGWGRQLINITPRGRALPCHAAETITSLTFETVRDKSLAALWADGSAFNAFRGDAWMQEPCRSCERRHVDFGGCRCQALVIAGDAAATDPACHLSPIHARMLDIAHMDSAVEAADYAYRGYRRTEPKR
jgi:pyrroloquinoline quinone biosynthesis protein E